MHSVKECYTKQTNSMPNEIKLVKDMATALLETSATFLSFSYDVLTCH